jgi:hypothetical protein
MMGKEGTTSWGGPSRNTWCSVSLCYVLSGIEYLLALINIDQLRSTDIVYQYVVHEIAVMLTTMLYACGRVTAWWSCGCNQSEVEGL